LDGGGASRSFLHTTFSPRWGFQLQIHWLFVLLLFYNGNRGGGSRVCVSYPWGLIVLGLPRSGLTICGGSFQIAFWFCEIFFQNFETSAMVISVSGEDLQVPSLL
jgi:hypothetical protein